MNELGRTMEPLSKQEQVWGKQMHKLAKHPEQIEAELDALGQKMNELGKKMEAIGDEIERASHVPEQKLRALVDEARANGLAKEAR